MSKNNIDIIKEKIKRQGQGGTSHPSQDFMAQSLEPKFEDLFTRETFYVDNDLREQLTIIAKRLGKGGKTAIINEAIRVYIEAHLQGEQDIIDFHQRVMKR